MWFTLNSFKNVSWSVPPCWKVCEKFLECLEHVSWTVLRLRCNLIKQCGFHDNLATHYIFLLSFFKYIDSQVHCRDRSRFFCVGGAPPRMCNVNKFWKGLMKKEAYYSAITYYKLLMIQQIFFNLDAEKGGCLHSFLRFALAVHINLTLQACIAGRNTECNCLVKGGTIPSWTKLNAEAVAAKLLKKIDPQPFLQPQSFSSFEK